MTAPVPVAAPVAAASAAPTAAPVAASPAPYAAPVAAPTAAPAGNVPSIGSVASGIGGGIPDEHFNSPILFRLLDVSMRHSQFEGCDVEAPTVDYIVINPANGEATEVRGLTVMQKLIRRDLVAAYRRGEQAVFGVAMLTKGSGANQAKVLRPLDDENTGYKAEDAQKFLTDLAVDTYHWWTRG